MKSDRIVAMESDRIVTMKSDRIVIGQNLEAVIDGLAVPQDAVLHRVHHLIVPDLERILP